MLVFRKRTRSDDIIEPSEFKAGLVVWVTGPDGSRQEHVCTGQNGECLPREEYLKCKAARAEPNRVIHFPKSKRSGSTRGTRSFFAR